MKFSTIGSNGIMRLLILVAGTLFLVSALSEAAPNYYSPIDEQNSEYVLETLARLKQALIAEENLENKRERTYGAKRGIDLGLGRGYSGSVAAKHLLGLAAANFAGGPGRRRRSEEEQ